MEHDKKAVGNRIKSIRMQLGLTLEQFGSLIDDASKSNVSKWETGVSIPNNKRMKLIATLGKTTVEELLHGSFEEFSFKEFSDYWEKHHIPQHIKKMGLHQAFKGFSNAIAEHEYLFDEDAMYSFIQNYFLHESLEFGIFNDYDEITFNVKAARLRIIKNPEGGLKSACDFNMAVELAEGDKWIVGVVGCFSKLLATPPGEDEHGNLKIFSHFDYGLSLQDEINHLTRDSNLFHELSIDQETFSNACQNFSKDKVKELVTSLLRYQIMILNQNGQMLNGKNTLAYEVVVNFFNKYFMIYNISEQSEIIFERFLENAEEHFISKL